MTDYSIVSRFRNKNQIEILINGLSKKGKTCYNFLDVPSDPNNPEADVEEQMKNFESVKDFYNNDHFKYLFNRDLNALKNAEKIILLLPAGISAHIEAGIAYGLGKPLVLIGEPEKADTLYLIFSERYKTIDNFLKTI
jgi:hypothetical protein